MLTGLHLLAFKLGINPIKEEPKGGRVIKERNVKLNTKFSYGGRESALSGISTYAGRSGTRAPPRHFN